MTREPHIRTPAQDPGRFATADWWRDLYRDKGAQEPDWWQRVFAKPFYEKEATPCRSVTTP